MRRWGCMYGDMGESDLSAESTTKAYQLRDRASDREKFFITAILRSAGDGKPGKGATDLSSRGRKLILVSSDPHGFLAGLFTRVLGQIRKGGRRSQESDRARSGLCHRV